MHLVLVFELYTYQHYLIYIISHFIWEKGQPFKQSDDRDMVFVDGYPGRK